jgi:small subunit ribosomal protein S13
MKQLKNLNTFYQQYCNKNLYSSLTIIHGINKAVVKRIELVNGFSRYRKLNEIEIKGLFFIKRQLIFFFDKEYNKELKNIEKYKKMRNYKGMRHTFKLPVRGQRTHTNAKTIRKYTKQEL